MEKVQLVSNEQIEVQTQSNEQAQTNKRSHTQTEEQINHPYRMQGLDLILMSINCQKYKTVFEENDINELALLHLTANDLRYLGVDTDDIVTIMTTVNVLKRTSDMVDVKLTNHDAAKMYTNICGQLGTITFSLLHYYNFIKQPDFEDMLIDNNLSAIDAALMLRPYLKAELNEMKNALKKEKKVHKKRNVMVTIVVCTSVLIGVTYWRLNYGCSSDFTSTCSNLISKMKIWKN